MKLQPSVLAIVALVATLAFVSVFFLTGHGAELAIAGTGAATLLALFAPAIVRSASDKDPPPPPPPAAPLPIILFLVLASLFAGSATASCAPAAASPNGAVTNPARETARAIVMLVAEGARSADELCAIAGKASANEKMLEVCAKAYGVARPAIMSAANQVDVWDAIDHKDIACAIGSAVRALDGALQAMVAAGVKVPLLISDAVKLGAAFAGGSCPAS